LTDDGELLWEQKGEIGRSGDSFYFKHEALVILVVETEEHPNGYPLIQEPTTAKGKMTTEYEKVQKHQSLLASTPIYGQRKHVESIGTFPQRRSQGHRSDPYLRVARCRRLLETEEAEGRQPSPHS
jgi:hypothetical protein